MADSPTAQVVREERRLARDKAVYQRIKQAYAASGGAAAGRRAAMAATGGSTAAWSDVGGPGAGAGGRRGSNAAGAVAAAARELRPIELVGIYEGQKEALEKELAAAKAEVGKQLWAQFFVLSQLRLGLQAIVCWLSWGGLEQVSS